MSDKELEERLVRICSRLQRGAGGNTFLEDKKEREFATKKLKQLIKDYTDQKVLETQIKQLESVLTKTKPGHPISKTRIRQTIAYVKRKQLKAPHKKKRYNTVTGKKDSIPIKVKLSPERGQADPLDEDDILEELR